MALGAGDGGVCTRAPRRPTAAAAVGVLVPGASSLRVRRRRWGRRWRWRARRRTNKDAAAVEALRAVVTRAFGVRSSRARPLVGPRAQAAAARRGVGITALGGPRGREGRGGRARLALLAAWVWKCARRLVLAAWVCWQPGFAGSCWQPGRRALQGSSWQARHQARARAYSEQRHPKGQLKYMHCGSAIWPFAVGVHTTV